MGAKKDAKKAAAEAAARSQSIEKTQKAARKAAKERKKKAKKEAKKAATWNADPRELLRIGGDFTLEGFARDTTPGFIGDDIAGETLLARRGEDFADLQERLYASSKNGANEAILLIIQGLDTSGKGGIIRHVVGQVDPQGIALKAFKVPTEEERSHDFLWRIRPHLPQPGYIGVFDRSHYEDLLVPTAQARLGQHFDQSWAVSEDELGRRYHEIYQMECDAVARGIRVIKVCLVVSYAEQGERLRERLERPDKHWKFSMGDLDTRDHWAQYQSAYSEVLSRSSTEIAPWYVIPADHKWYARLAVQEILVRTLEDINPQWPAADFDLAEAEARLNLTTSPEALVPWASERSAPPSSKDSSNEGEAEPTINLGAL
ncbi:MAG: polyphosphate kinase 2 family protein [Actinomycetaceae bacterium]|nr:polyphosphate kinase 2 family protein [Actinomycetaceae bacterium]